MSTTKDGKKKAEKDPDQVSAHDTLINIISSLSKISTDEINIPEPENNPEDSLDLSEKPVHVICIICKQPIERSNFIVSLQCCGEIAHIKCFAKISADEQTTIPHECPKCKEQFNREQAQICQRLSSMIQY